MAVVTLNDLCKHYGYGNKRHRCKLFYVGH